MKYTIHYRSSNRLPTLVDGSFLRPDTLCTVDREAFAATPIPIGRTSVRLDEVFAIGGPEPSPTPFLLVMDTPPLDRLGANMAHGKLVVFRDVGDELGASMSGGHIRVLGNAGHRVGGPDHASRRGMTGGEILIDGDAGDYAGFLMRRGLIAIAGRCGKSPGYRMLAGTIALLTDALDAPGIEMQRGTILCLRGLVDASNAAPLAASHLAEGGEVAASAMPAMLLVLRRLQDLRWPLVAPLDAARATKARWRIASGDRFEHNKGEVLQCLV